MVNDKRNAFSLTIQHERDNYFTICLLLPDGPVRKKMVPALQ